jgi:hypothetical protein
VPDARRDGRERQAVLRLSEAGAEIARALRLGLPLLPEPRRQESLPGQGALLVGGDPALVVMRVTAAGIRIGAARLRFWGPRPVLVEERLATLPHSLLPRDDAAATEVLRGLCDAAAALRRSELHPCGRCRLPRAPEEVAIVAETVGTCPFCGRLDGSDAVA